MHDGKSGSKVQVGKEPGLPGVTRHSGDFDHDRPSSLPDRWQPRVAFYSHDTFGLGHLNRCIKIASGFKEVLGDVKGIFLTGLPHADLFEKPIGFDFVQLPPVTKLTDGGYAPREAGHSYADVCASRRQLIRKTLRAFCPDLVVVDNVPCGLHGEVVPGLAEAKLRGARIVLALRDILDDPVVINAEWEQVGAARIIDSLYDEVWVFGSAEDAEQMKTAGPLSMAGEKVVACGALDSGRLVNPRTRRDPDGRPEILVTVGGGGDAAQLIDTYVAALNDFRPDVSSRIVVGPDYPLEPFEKILLHEGIQAEVVQFCTNLSELMASADVVVAMAGYNTVCELRESGCRAVLVPRVRPRMEQWIRAQALARRCGTVVLHPDTLCPRSLWDAIEGVLASARPEVEHLQGRRVAAMRAVALVGSSSITSDCDTRG